jgi:hypothetical protein
MPAAVESGAGGNPMQGPAMALPSKFHLTEPMGPLREDTLAAIGV